MSAASYGEPTGTPGSLKGVRVALAVVAVVVFVTACSPSDDRAGATSPEPSRQVSVPEGSPEISAPVRRPRARVLVYLLRKDGDGYRRGAYDPLPRPARGARGPGERMQVALAELVRGTTRAERRRGYTSAFTRETADVVLRAELRGRRAVVDFEDFRREHGQWGASYGGSVFLMQLSRTIFQFDRVRSALLRIDRNCGRFWEFLQMRCEILRRP